MEKCPKCGKRFPSKIEESALNKLRVKNPDEYEKLAKVAGTKICVCLHRMTGAIASSEQPPGLAMA